MNENISGTRNLIMYDMVYGWYVQSPRRDISRQKNGIGSRLESTKLGLGEAKISMSNEVPIEVFEALTLLQLRMQRECFEIKELQEGCKTSDPINR